MAPVSGLSVEARRRGRDGLASVSRAGFVILASALAVALLFAISGYDVMQVGETAVTGSITGPNSFVTTMRWAIIFLVIGAGVLVAVRAGFFNVGAQGQFLVGSLVAVAVALRFETAPAGFVIVLAAGLGAVAGAVWSLLPGLLRVRYGTDEVVTTLMMNFIGILVVQYFAAGPLQDTQSSAELAATRTVPEAVRLSDASGVSGSTVAIALAVLALTWVLMNRTRFGISAALAGRNPTMARATGVDIARLGLVSFAVSGGLAGLAGALEVLGADGRVVAGATADLGFTSIVVALVAGAGVVLLGVSALFFGALQAAVLYLPIASDVPTSGVQVLRGVIALLITSAPAVVAWRRRRDSGTEEPVSDDPVPEMERVART